MQDTGFGFLWVSLVPSFKFPFLTALAKQGETTQCQHSRHGSQRSPQQRCRRHQHSHLETDPNTPNEVQRRKQEEQSTLQWCDSMLREEEQEEEERGDEWRATRDRVTRICLWCTVWNQLSLADSKREREKEQETKIMGRGLYGWQPLLNKEKSVTAGPPPSSPKWLYVSLYARAAWTHLHTLVCCTADSHLYTHREILKITRGMKRRSVVMREAVLFTHLADALILPVQRTLQFNQFMHLLGIHDLGVASTMCCCLS